MGFSADERATMLALQGVGPTVVVRLEELGLTSLAALAGNDPAAITRAVAEMLRARCWANSPMARSAISAVVALANERYPPPD